MKILCNITYHVRSSQEAKEEEERMKCERFRAFSAGYTCYVNRERYASSYLEGNSRTPPELQRSVKQKITPKAGN